MSNDGINTGRLGREPTEKLFHDLWKEHNKDQRALRFLLDRTHDNRGDYRPTGTEQEVAATVIQWLGSPVGQGFLESAGFTKGDGHGNDI